jgi:hypothetical protein
VIDPSDPNVVYTIGHGGIYRSTAGGTGDWEFIGGGISNTEIYDLALAPTDPNFAIIGTQDNGTPVYEKFLQLFPRWGLLQGGDGGTVDVDPTTSDVVYAQYVRGSEMTQQRRLPFLSSGWSERQIGLPDPPGRGCLMFHNKPRRLHFLVHPGDRLTVLATCTAGEGVCEENDATCNGGLWRRVFEPAPLLDLIGAPVGGEWEVILPVGMIGSEPVRTAVDASADLYYVGTKAGSVWVSQGGQPDNWSEVLPADGDGGAVVDIDVDPHDSSVVYVTRHGSRVIRLVHTSAIPNAAGVVSSSIVNSDVEGTITSLAVDPINPMTIYVGSAAMGVYRGTSPDDGTTWLWRQYSYGLPSHVWSSDLEAHPTTGDLFLATFGRSVYRTPNSGVCGDNLVNSPLEICDGSDDSACPGDCLDVGTEACTCCSSGGSSCVSNTECCSGMCIDETCSEACVPNCAGRECGADGCGGVCGVCGPESICNEQLGVCVVQ